MIEVKYSRRKTLMWLVGFLGILALGLNMMAGLAARSPVITPAALVGALMITMSLYGLRIYYRQLANRANQIWVSGDEFHFIQRGERYRCSLQWIEEVRTRKFASAVDVRLKRTVAFGAAHGAVDRFSIELADYNTTPKHLSARLNAICSERFASA